MRCGFSLICSQNCYLVLFEASSESFSVSFCRKRTIISFWGAKYYKYSVYPNTTFNTHTSNRIGKISGYSQILSDRVAFIYPKFVGRNIECFGDAGVCDKFVNSLHAG